MMQFAAGPLRWARTSVLAAAPAGRSAVFIDKDGTLIEHPPADVDPAQLRLRPGAAETLAELAGRGFALLVATNQSGLARGHYTRAEFARLQAALEQLLEKASGVKLLDFLVCPHAPAADGSPSCLCRKPAPGLLLRAARRHGIDLSRSWMVGDALDDVEAGHRAGCRSVLLGDDPAGAAPQRALRQPELRCPAWQDVALQLPASAAPSTLR